MKDLYVLKYTERQPYGAWVSHDEKRIDGYGDLIECQEYYVAPSAELAKAQWDYWNKYTDKNRERKFLSIVHVAKVHVMLMVGGS